MKELSTTSNVFVSAWVPQAAAADFVVFERVRRRVCSRRRVRARVARVAGEHHTHPTDLLVVSLWLIYIQIPYTQKETTITTHGFP